MKRKLSIILCACFLMSCMVVPASADEFSGFDYIDVLDFGGVNGGDRHVVTYTGGEVYFNLPSSTPVGYIDIVISVSGIAINSCSFSVPSGSSTNLSILSIGDGLYRLYGSFNLAWASKIILNFGRSSSGNTYITFHKVNISSTHYLGYQDLAFFAVAAGPFQYMTTPGTAVTYSWEGVYDPLVLSSFTGYIYLQNWKKYDFVDISFSLNVNSLTSISANLDDVYLPFEISYLDYSSSSWYSASEDFHSQDIPRNATVNLRIDLSGVDRSSSSYIQIAFSGVYDNSIYSMCSFTLRDYWGFVEIDNEDSFLPYWLQKIFSQLATLTSSLGTWFSDLNTHLSDLFNSLSSSLDSRLVQIYALIDAWGELNYKHLSDFFTNLDTWISNQTSSLITEFTNLKSKLTTEFTSLKSKIGTEFTNLKTSLSTHFTNLKSWIQSQTSTLEAAIRGDTSPGDSFQDEVDEKDQQLDDMAAVMDSVNKPALDSINVNVDQYVAAADITLLASPLQVFLTGDIFGPIIIMTLIFATVSYVLYGKRG